MSKQTTYSHPVATKNRVNLASEIVDYLDAEADAFFTAGKPTVGAVAAFGPAVWQTITTNMGRDRLPSSETVAVVLGILIGRA